jgi:hypothetical protein
MSAKQIARTIAVSLAVLFVHLILPAGLFAQAWVPLKGEGSLSTTYSNMYVRNHVNFRGVRNPAAGRIRTNTTLTSFEYGITDKLALTADVAYIASKYIGKDMHGPDDTGSYHPTFQDARLELRYNALKRAVVVTPFIGVTIPTHDYETRGHSAVGRGFHEVLLGVSVGRQLDRLLRDSYVDARYSYTVQRRFAGLNLNRSNADWEVGWFASKRFSIRFLGNWQTTHGGFNLPVDVHRDVPEEFDIHDRVARAKFIHLGGGIGLSVTRSFGIHAAYVTTTYARNSHAAGGFLAGISWSFSRGLRLDRASTNASSSRLASSVQAVY